jgi:hypothetical protein
MGQVFFFAVSPAPPYHFFLGFGGHPQGSIFRFLLPLNNGEIRWVWICPNGFLTGVPDLSLFGFSEGADFGHQRFDELRFFFEIWIGWHESGPSPTSTDFFDAA